jgi:hypothetical protein
MKPVSGSSGPGPGPQGVGLSHAPGQAKKEEKAAGKSGEKKALSTQAPESQQQSPSMEEAIQKLDVALKTLAANLKTDSYEGATAPAGAGGSKLDNPLETMAGSTFSAPAPTATFAPVQSTSALNDPILAEKGGGGAGGGVDLNKLMSTAMGGGGAGGGVDMDVL